MIKCTSILQNELSLTNQHIQEIFGDVDDESESVMNKLQRKLSIERLFSNPRLLKDNLETGIDYG